MSSAGIALNPKGNGALVPFQLDGARFPHGGRSTESILIYLSVPGSPVIQMRVLESDSIASVKLQIQTFRGFVVRNQKLVFAGRELARNDSAVRDYGIGDGGVLHLVIRLSDIRAITVRTACGRKLRFNVERGRTVSYLKQQIARSHGEGNAEPWNQRLVYDDGEELDDRCLISDISDAIVHLLVCKSAKFVTKPVKKDFELSILAPDLNFGNEVPVVPRRIALVEPVIVNSKVRISPVIKELIRATFAGLEKGNSPIMSTEGSGGAYFMQSESGDKFVAVFKPIDEEPLALNNPRDLPMSTDGEGMKRGTRVGEGALREVAAYVLDHPLKWQQSYLANEEAGFSGVPPTAMVRCLSAGFNHPNGYDNVEKYCKIGSLQMFVKNSGSCEDMGPQVFTVEQVHKICVLDIRLANTDRHAGNILVCRDEENEGCMTLVPIDHGYCLPEHFEDCTFEWLYWPQSRQPFNSETIDYIRSLDAEQDIALLKFYGWELPLECARTLRISTMLLKKGAERGLSPFDIGSILCRETLKKESKIEEIVREAKDAVLPGTSEAALMETISEIMDRCLDKSCL